MDSPDRNLRDGCQLMSTTEFLHEPLWRSLLRRVRNVLRRVRRILGIGRAWERPFGPTGSKPAVRVPADVNTGDRVRVRSLDEIMLTLDAKGACGGCAFLEPMAQYCGKELRVAKRVDHFFDERHWRMLKCRSMVLLEGSHCDGSGHPDTRGCQRMCFFFWRTEWLERVD